MGDMDWTGELDLYCERLGPGFWAEPWNAVTNASFVLAAFAALWFARREDRLDGAIVLLLTIMMAIGIGSFLFHTYATRWAVMADVIPIQLFILSYFAFAMRRFAGFPWWGAGLATAAFMAFAVVGGGMFEAWFGEALNGSEGYLPPLIGLVVVGLALAFAGRPGPGWALVIAGAIFAVSLTFRTIDEAVCADFPRGTHFVWHTLNGVLLGVLVFAMVRHGRPRTAEAA